MIEDVDKERVDAVLLIAERWTLRELKFADKRPCIITCSVNDLQIYDLPQFALKKWSEGRPDVELCVRCCCNDAVLGMT